MLKSCAFLIIFLIMAVSQVAFAGPAQEPLDYVPGELIVRFNDGVNQVAVDRAISMVNGKLIKRFERIHALHVKVPTGTAERAVNLLKGFKGVKYAELNALRSPDTVPNDTFYTSLWNLNNTGQTGGTYDADIDAPEAWNSAQGTSHMVVAVIDTGLDMAHEDIAANVYTNPREIAGNGIDDDGNGYIDDVHGWDFVHDLNDPSDRNLICNGHGTHTAGILGAVGNNNIGITGVNWHVQIMPLKVLGGFYCRASSANIISAINYAADMGVKVSNNSYGGGPFSQAEKDAIQASRTLFVAAAGNFGLDSDTNPHYPAAYDLPNIISVASTDYKDRLAVDSNFGINSVDLAAPGVNIFSTTPLNTYTFMDGTSMAAPHVTGATALLMAKDPILTVNEAKLRILDGVDPLGLPVATGGRLNINNALLMPSPVVSIDVAPNGPQTIPLGGSASFSISISNNALTRYTVNVFVVAVLPDGSSTPIGAKIFSLGPAALATGYFTRVVPATFAAGRYDILGRVEVIGISYDEDQLSYTVTP